MRDKIFDGNTNRLLNKYPILEDDVSIHLSPTEGFLYIYNYKSLSNKNTTKDYISISINIDAQKLLAQFDGTKPLALIIRELTDGEENYIASIPSVLEFLVKLTEFVGFPFIKFSDKPSRKKIEITGDLKTLLPVHATLELTDKCNLRCNYCYRESDSTKNTFLHSPLTLLQSMYDVGIRHIELSGGEPLLHPDLLQILKYLGEKFNIVALLTNGILLTEEIIEIVANYKRKFIIQICLDGSTPENVDNTTGIKGSFERITKAIRLVSGRSLRLRIGMVIDSPTKIDDIENTLLLAKDLGATWFVVNPAINIGRGQQLNLIFSESDAIRFSYLLRELEEKYKGFFSLNPGGVMDDLEKSHNCGAGHRTITIGPDRKVRPCPMFPEEFGFLCKIQENQVKEALKNSYTEIFYKIKSPNPAICGECPWFFYCMTCFTRGLKKAKEIGYNKCRWFEMAEVKELKEKYLKNFE